MRYNASQYAKVLYEIAGDTTVAKRRDMIRDFLDAVAKNGSLSILPDIIREFENLSDTEAGIHHVTVRTPERLPTEGLSKKLPFKAKVTALRDVRLGGGAVVEVDDLRIDNSVAMRMSRAREAFTK